MKLSEELEHCLSGDYCGECEHYSPEIITTCRGILQKAYTQIKEYEDLEGQRKLIMLPVSVGDKVYRIWSCGKNGKSIAEFTVSHIDIDSLPKIEFSYCKENSRCRYYFSKVEDIGNNVFLTKEQAEAALQRMNETEE